MDYALPVFLIRASAVSRLTPRVARVEFTSDDLAGFRTWPDQQVKLCFPRAGQNEPRMPGRDGTGGTMLTDAMRWYRSYLAIAEDERPWMRSFTIRAYDPDRQVIVIDFVLHGDDGPASRWAAGARPGDVLGVVGPSRMYTRPLGDAATYLFAGDASALPAIGTLVESLPAGKRAVVFANVAGAAEEQGFVSAADVTVIWVHGEGSTLVEAVRAARLPEGPVFAWIAGESAIVRAIRAHLVADRNIGKRDIEFSGYWRSRLTADDAPTPEDIAEAQEKVSAARR